MVHRLSAHAPPVNRRRWTQVFMIDLLGRSTPVGRLDAVASTREMGAS